MTMGLGSRMWWRRKGRGDVGQRGERAAEKHLKGLGYKILECNLRVGRNEIDLLALEGDTLVFVEVRTRTSPDPVLPEDSVGPEKQRQLRKAARGYCATLDRDDLYMRFDVVSVLMPPGGEVVITLFRDAFQ